MNQRSQKYPSRADTLALLKARENGVPAAAPRTAAAAASRADAPICIGTVSAKGLLIR